ncbi:hypothetical protein ARTHRO9V_280001 [Arthrobacter sp. 9V]|nr:hypothetical protein ARTHRO9V_280001 [Arthrobacter sp. 9V]
MVSNRYQIEIPEPPPVATHLPTLVWNS